MAEELRIEHLADHVEVLAELVRWFEDEWPSWYGPGGRGDARADLRAYAASRSRLPIGVVALRGDGTPCGVAALKADSMATHPHLGPWIAAGLVPPELRGQGIGAALVRALEGIARELGHERVYCATATAGSLLRRSGFVFREDTVIEGATTAIYEKALRPRPAPR